MLLVIPFFLGGYIFSLIFTHFKEKITLLYFFDLVGGGLGVVFMLLFFPNNGPFVLIFYLGLAMILVSFLFMFSFHWIPSIFILVAIPVYLSYFKNYKNLEIRVSTEKKDVSATGKILFKNWDNFGYVVMVEKTNGSKFVTADFTCYTYFYAPRKNFKEYQFITPAHNYPYVIKKNPENVGIVGVGAGKDVLTALGFGAKNIYGAEFNTTIYNLFKNFYSNEFKPGGSFSNVHIVREEGRFFLRTSKLKYDDLNKIFLNYNKNINKDSLFDAYNEIFNFEDKITSEDEFNKGQKLFIIAENISDIVHEVADFLRNKYKINISCLEYTVMKTDNKEIIISTERVVGFDNFHNTTISNTVWNEPIKVKKVVENAVKSFTKNNFDIIFTPKEIYNVIIKEYPNFNKNTLNCQIIADCVNHTSRKHYPSGQQDLYYRVNDGKYRLYNKEKDGNWTFEGKKIN